VEAETMNTKHWYQLDQSEVLHILQTRLTGLNAGEVIHRQKTHREYSGHG
jgi:hypothetical protein